MIREGIERYGKHSGKLKEEFSLPGGAKEVFAESVQVTMG